MRHSSIWPKGENMTRMSFSLHFLETIPMNSFRSSTAVGREHCERCPAFTLSYAYLRGGVVQTFPPACPLALPAVLLEHSTSSSSAFAQAGSTLVERESVD